MNSELDSLTSNRSKAISVDWQEIPSDLDLGAGMDRITSIEGALDATQTLRDIARVTSEVLQADLVVIYPYVQEDDRFGDPVVWGQLHGGRESLHAPRKAGLAARIIEDGLVVVGNVARCPELVSDFVLQESIVAFLGVALRVDEEIVGVLYVDFRDTRHFAERELVIVEGLASLGAAALYNARINRIAYKALLGKIAVEEQARRELAALREVDKAILSSAVDLGETLQVILDKGLGLIGAEHGQLSLIEGGELVIRATTTQPQEKELGTRLPIEDSVSGIPVLTKASVRVPDVRQRPEYKAILKTEQGGMLSELAVPLVEDGRVIGVLNFESPHLNAFTEHDQDLLEALAGQAAIAIRNARYLKEMATLREIDRAILSPALDLDQIYELILVEGARKLIGATHGSVVLLENGELVIKATMGDDWTDELRNTRLKVGEGITGWVAQEGKSHLVRDVRQEGKQYVSWFDDVKSELAVPLKIGDRVMGVINVDSTVVDGFDEHEQQLLEALAAQASIALRNSGHVRSLELLRQIDNAISSTFDLNEIYELILVEGARKLIGATHGSVALVENGELVIKATMGDDWTDELRDTRLKVGEGITGWVAQEGKSHLVRDVRQEAKQYVSWFDDVKSELAVPLKVGDRVAGVINVDSMVVDGFDEHEQQLLEALAAQAGVAIQNASLVASLQLLMEIDRTISSASDLDQIYKLILVEGARKLIGATHGSVVLLENGELVIKATMGDDWTDELRNTRLKVGEGITGWVAQEGKSHLVRDVRQEGKRYVSWFDDVKSELAVPLKVSGRVRGVINVDSMVVDGFDEHEQQLLEALAAQAGVAIQNADHIESLQLLIEIDHAISSTLDLDQIYELILLEGARKLIGATHGSVALVENGDLVIKATMGDDWTDELRNTRLKVGEGITGWVAQTGQSYLMRDCRQEGEQYERWFDDVQSELAVPLKAGDRVVGVINVDSTVLDCFDERDQDLLEALAGQAAVALSEAETQEQLLQAESIKAIGMATAELTHWIGNRTLPILWAVERVIEDVGPEDESVLEDLELIKRNAETILEIKRNFLGSALELQLVPTMIGDPLKDTVKMMGIPKDVRTRVLIQPNLPLVRVDSVQFTQVLENLIKNALEAMDEVDRESELTISAYFAAEDKAVKIEVRDNGTGIAPEHLETIWVPFFSTKKGKGGAGIGLPASAQIISKMHGTIHVESELGQGTTFTIELPAMS